MTTGKTRALTRWTLVGKVMSLLLNMLSRLVITFLPGSKHLLISRLQSPSAVILETKKIKPVTVSTVSPIYLQWSDGTGCHDLTFLNVEFCFFFFYLQNVFIHTFLLPKQNIPCLISYMSIILTKCIPIVWFYSPIVCVSSCPCSGFLLFSAISFESILCISCINIGIDRRVCLFVYLILLYNTVLVLPYINMNLPQVYTCSLSWTPLPIPSLWVIPVHQPQASDILHRTWTGNLFFIWYYTCFNAILPNHPTLSLSHRVLKTVLYICVSFSVSHTGLSLPPF